MQPKSYTRCRNCYFHVCLIIDSQFFFATSNVIEFLDIFAANCPFGQYHSVADIFEQLSSAYVYPCDIVGCLAEQISWRLDHTIAIRIDFG